MKRETAKRWTFLTNHAHVLLAIARDPTVRLRDVADAVGITERAAFAIVSDLEEEGFITKRKIGRRNVYRVDPEVRLRHPLEADHEIGVLFALIRPPERSGRQ